MTSEEEDLRREIDELSVEFGGPAYLLYAMGLHLGTLDYRALQSDALLDGPDDKKIDFIHFDFEEDIATVAQSYRAVDWDASDPKSSKAAELNTAMSWLLEADLASIPRPEIRAAAEQLRDALSEREISRIELFFVHNLPESAAVEAELAAVQRTTQRLLERYGSDAPTPPECVARQVGRGIVVDWRRSQHEAIAVHDEIALSSVTTPQELHEPEWHAVVAVVPAQELVALRAKYGDALSSANVRDYLGSRQTARNINRQIEKSAQDEPRNFLIYNNGITVLTRGIRVDGNRLHLSGMAIINGAQTTGSLAQAAIKGSVVNANVLVRAVKVNDTGLIDSVIRYNNTQNPIKAWELRVIDPIQRKLGDQFQKIGLTYQLRRGSGRRKTTEVTYETLGPSLSAFYGDPIVAHKNKAELFENEARYRKLFDENSDVRNLLLVYRLGASVAKAKAKLKERIEAGTASEDDKAKYAYFRYGSFAFVVTHVCAEVIGLLLRAGDATFKKRVTLEDGTLFDAEKGDVILVKLVEAVLGPIHMYLKGRDAYRELKTLTGVEAIANHAKTIVEQVHHMHPETYAEIVKPLRVI